MLTFPPMSEAEIEWRRSQPKVIVTEPIRLSKAEFLEMREMKHPDNLCAPPYTLCKVMCFGRWHAVDRQYSYGMPMHFARPIVIALKTADLDAQR